MDFWSYPPWLFLHSYVDCDLRLDGVVLFQKNQYHESLEAHTGHVLGGIYKGAWSQLPRRRLCRRLSLPIGAQRVWWNAPTCLPPILRQTALKASRNYVHYGNNPPPPIVLREYSEAVTQSTDEAKPSSHNVSHLQVCYLEESITDVRAEAGQKYYSSYLEICDRC